MNPEQNDIFEIDLMKILELLLQKFYILLLCAVIGGGAAFGYGKYFVEPTYSSTAYLYVNNSLSLSDITSSVALGESRSLVSTYLVILKTRTTLETVIKKAGLNYSYSELSKMINTGSVNSTEIFQVTVTSHDPEEACMIVNTIAELFPDKVNNIISGTSAKVVDYGVVNRAKIAPSLSKFALVGAFAGACLAALVIVIIYLLDETIREEDYLVSTYDVPIIGTIPNLFEDKKNKYKSYDKKSKYRYYYKPKDKNDDTNEEHNILCEHMHFDAKEAYKLLRTNLQFALNDSGDSNCKVLGISSAVRGEGKSTTACNLAYTIAQANQKVLLIDGDMRLPSISSKLNVKAKKGLSDYVIGKAALKDVIYAYNESLPNFHILLSGTIPPNPSELLGSKAMKDVIDSLKKKYDFIIIDLPPVNIVTDALVTKDYVDGLVVTIRQNYSNKREVTACVNSVEFLQANLVGFIFDNVNEDRSYYAPKIGYKKYYSYGHRYGKYYRKDDYRYGYYSKDNTEENK